MTRKQPTVISCQDEPVGEHESEVKEASQNKVEGRVGSFDKGRRLPGTLEGESSSPALKSACEYDSGSWAISQLRPEEHLVVDPLSPPAENTDRQNPTFQASRSCSSGSDEVAAETFVECDIENSDSEAVGTSVPTENASIEVWDLEELVSPAPTPQILHVTHDPSLWTRVKCKVLPASLSMTRHPYFSLNQMQSCCMSVI